jgi:transposase
MSDQPPPTPFPGSPDDERARRRVENVSLRAENAVLHASVAALTDQIGPLCERIADLEVRVAKDSHHSSKPPSSAPPFKKPPPRSLRRLSGRKPGGQKGHDGTTCALVEEPDRRVILPLTGACACGRGPAEIPAQPRPARRQVVEWVVRREVVEYRTVSGVCACGRRHHSVFPDDVAAPVQYGASVAAFAVDLRII